MGGGGSPDLEGLGGALGAGGQDVGPVAGGAGDPDVAHVLAARQHRHLGLALVELGGGGRVGHEVGGDAARLVGELLAHPPVGAADPLVLVAAPRHDHRHRVQRLGLGGLGEDEVAGADDAPGEHVGVAAQQVVHERPADGDAAHEDPLRVDRLVGRHAGDQVHHQRLVRVRAGHGRRAHGVPRPPHLPVLVAHRGDHDPPVVGQLVDLGLLEELVLLLHRAGQRHEQGSGLGRRLLGHQQVEGPVLVARGEAVVLPGVQVALVEAGRAVGGRVAGGLGGCSSVGAGGGLRGGGDEGGVVVGVVGRCGVVGAGAGGCEQEGCDEGDERGVGSGGGSALGSSSQGAGRRGRRRVLWRCRPEPGTSRPASDGIDGVGQGRDEPGTERPGSEGSTGSRRGRDEPGTGRPASGGTGRPAVAGISRGG